MPHKSPPTQGHKKRVSYASVKDDCSIARQAMQMWGLSLSSCGQGKSAHEPFVGALRGREFLSQAIVALHLAADGPVPRFLVAAQETGRGVTSGDGAAAPTGLKRTGAGG